MKIHDTLELQVIDCRNELSGIVIADSWEKKDVKGKQQVETYAKAKGRVAENGVGVERKYWVKKSHINLKLSYIQNYPNCGDT